jgi:phage tail sheath protein FI
MSFQISPGVNVSEIDLTTIIPAVGTTVGAIAGPFAWGPAFKPMLIDSELTLLSTFGKPDNGCANNWFSASNFLAYGSAMQIVRVVKQGSTISVVPANGDGTGRGATAQIEVDDSGTITSVSPIQIGELYQSAPTVIVLGDGSGAVIHANLGSGGTADKVVSYTIVEGGSGYIVGHKNATAIGKGVLIPNQDAYLNNFSFGDSNLGVFAAKYPGILGNSLAVSMADEDSFASWAYKLEFGGAPNTSSAVATGGGQKDEIHVVVIDALGFWTGTPDTVLERFAFLSKCPDAKYEDGSTMYYPEVLNRKSKYIWWMDHPTATELGIDTPLANWGGDKTTNFDTMATKLAVNTVTGDFIVGETVADATGAVVSSGQGATLGTVVIGSGGVLTIPVSVQGSGYLVPPHVVISGDGSGALAVANLGSGGTADKVVSITVTAPGTGYTNATAAITSGSGATAGSITFNTGVITVIPVSSGGSNYTSVPTVGISGDGSGATAHAVLGSGGTAGQVVSIVVDNGGTGYTNATATITAVGTGATAGSVTFNTGKILSVPVSNGGTGYVTPPTIVISGNGSGATGTAVMNGQILQSVTITNAGTGYTTASAVATAVGSGATAAVTVNANGRIIALTPTNLGTGYTVAPLVSVTGPGTGAQIQATLDGSGHVSGYTVINGGSGYNTISAKVISWADSILEISPIYGEFQVTQVVKGLSSGAVATVTDLEGGSLFVELSGGIDANEHLVDGEFINGLDLFKSGEDIDISLMVTGDASANVQQYAVSDIAEFRKDCVAFLSPPKDLVVDNAGNEAADIVVWRDSLPSSSYAVADSGWKYQYDKYSDIYRWVPLNGDVAGLCVRTDTQRDPWWSPAGYNRGLIQNVVRLAWNPRKAYRDVLYQAGVNPVISDPGQGTLLFGDKTMLAKPSAFDRINVRRLFVVIEKAIATASKFTLFEFNDQFTRAQFVNMVEPYLREVMGRRGIFDFRVVCDETNNSPEVIDSNQFVGDIYIKPARSINFIQLNFVAVRTGVDFSEIVGKF